MSAHARRKADDLRRTAADLTWIAAHLERFVERCAEFEARGWPSSNADGTGRSPQGGTPTGINPQPDPIRNARVHTMDALQRAVTEVPAVRRFVATIVEPKPAGHGSHAAEEYCSNPNCSEIIRHPDGDYPLLSRCLPCHSYWTSHGIDPSARVIADRLRKRAARQ